MMSLALMSHVIMVDDFSSKRNFRYAMANYVFLCSPHICLCMQSEDQAGS